jgi:ATP-dependent DNA helicase HFM1/MER3
MTHTHTHTSALVQGPQHRAELARAASRISDHALAECVRNGVGFHHAAVDRADRALVESLFSAHQLGVVVCTSTLATGVNLPAHLVVVKSTQTYRNGRLGEYSRLELAQMVGRAGRPGLDDSGRAVLMTTTDMCPEYESLLSDEGSAPIESRLHLQLAEHVNAEITLGTVHDSASAVAWLQSTYFCVRVRRRPQHYGLRSAEAVDAWMRSLTDAAIDRLAAAELVEITDAVKPAAVKDEVADGAPRPLRCRALPFGASMARNYVALPTCMTFHGLGRCCTLRDILRCLCDAHEYAEDLGLRGGEKGALAKIAGDERIRWKCCVEDIYIYIYGGGY